MKVKVVFYDIDNNKEINWGRIGNVVQGYCDYFAEDPYLIMSYKTLEELSVPFIIERDDIKDVLVSRNILNGRSLDGVYTGGYKVFVDDDLPFGVVDVR